MNNSISDRTKFYTSLYDSDEFISELGKMTLEMGRLEAELKTFLQKVGIRTNLGRDTLGLLIAKLNNCELINSQDICRFNDLRKQRNFLTHNLYAILSNQVEERSTSVVDRLQDDVESYVEHVLTLRRSIRELMDMLYQKEQKLAL